MDERARQAALGGPGDGGPAVTGPARLVDTSDILSGMTQTPARARDPLAVAAPPRDPDNLTVEQLTARLRAAIQYEAFRELAGQLHDAHHQIRHLTRVNDIAQRQLEAERVTDRRLKAKTVQLQRRLDTRDAANHRALLAETPTAVLLAELGRRATELPEAGE